MRVVFMGTPSFAVPSLVALAGVHEVVAVYSRPDSVSGRGGKLRPSEVKQAAEQLGIEVRQPTTLRASDEQQYLRTLAPDVIVVAAYGLILPPEVLQIPRLGCVNVHASLLPRWRGAAPIQRAILAGDQIAGVSIMQMEEGLDTGPWCASGAVEIDDLDATTLTARLADLGARTLLEALPQIESGGCEWQQQDESQVTYAEKIAKSDVAVSPALTILEAVRRVRASSDQAPSRVVIEGRGARLLAVLPGSETIASGFVACRKDAMLLGMTDGSLRVESLKPDGKKQMRAADWARGAHLADGAKWEAAQ